MFKARRHLMIAALVLCASWALPTVAQVGAWPSKPIKMVVPYPAGGNADAIGRYAADRLGQVLGQPIVVDNRAGAGAILGSELVARAAGDGYTLLLAPTAVLAITPHLRKVPYDPFSDFVPIARLSGSYSIATARKDAPFNNMKELVEQAKREPGKITFGSAGLATATHIAGELINRQAKIQTLHIPYKGSAEALNDLVGGRIDLIYDPVSLTQIKAGNVKAIAVLSQVRHPELPAVPTVAEQGFPVDGRSWFGLFAAKGTPAPVVQRMAAEIQKILAQPEARTALLKVSQYPDFLGPEEFAKQIREDSLAFKELIVQTNLRVE